MVETYPEMNRIIVDLLSGSEHLHVRYAAMRIEELESQLKKMKIQRNLARTGRTEQSERARFLSVELAQVREKILLETCTWKYDGQDCWETECDNLLYSPASVPKRGGFNFCPYCGLPIAVGEPHYFDEAWDAMKKVYQNVE